MTPLRDQDIIIERGWLGPGKGAALSIRHVPTGACVQRTIGYEREAPHRQQLLAELQTEVCRHHQNNHPRRPA